MLELGDGGLELLSIRAWPSSDSQVEPMQLHTGFDTSSLLQSLRCCDSSGRREGANSARGAIAILAAATTLEACLERPFYTNYCKLTIALQAAEGM